MEINVYKKYLKSYVNDTISDLHYLLNSDFEGYNKVINM